MKFRSSILNLKDSPLISNSIVSSIDQSLISGINFVVAIILLKTLTKEEFGYYAIALPVIYFIISIQNATINTPLAVLLPPKENKTSYVSSLWFGLVLLSMPVVLILVVSVFYAKSAGLIAPGIASIAIAVGVSSVGILLREYLRAYFFANHSPGKVFKLDICYSCLYLSSVVGLSHFFNIDIYSVFLLMGLSSLIVAYSVYMKRGWEVNYPDILPSYRENWKYGRWALLGVAVSHIQSYSYIYLLGFLLGSAAVADVAASKLLLMPIVLFQAGWCKVAVPYGAKLNHENRKSEFFQKSIAISACLLALICLYVFLLNGLSSVLATYLFNEKYSRAFDYVLLWAAVFCMRSLVINASAGLQSIREFKILSLFNTITMIFTVVSSYWLITLYGILGGFTAQIIGETFLAITLWATWIFKTVRTKLPLTAGFQLAGKN